jgi:hypothetical protein
MEERNMGEAKRRQTFRFLPDTSEDTHVIGEMIHYTTEALAHRLLSEYPPSDELKLHLQLAEGLRTRIQDKTKETVLCAICDYDFARNEAPASFVFIVPKITKKGERRSVLVQALCLECTSHEWSYIREKLLQRLKSEITDVDGKPDNFSTIQ